MLLALGVGLFTFSLIVITAQLILKDKISINQRFDKIFTKNANVKIVDVKHEKKRREHNFLSKLKIVDQIDMQLTSAGLPMRAEEFLIIWLVIIFVPSGLTVLYSRNIITSIALAFIGGVAPLVVVKRAKHKRLEEFTVQLSDALITLSNCLRSGLSLAQGMESISIEMADPLAKEFGKA